MLVEAPSAFLAVHIESVLRTNCLNASEKSVSSYFHRLTVPVFHNSRVDPPRSD